MKHVNSIRDCLLDPHKRCKYNEELSMLYDVHYADLDQYLIPPAPYSSHIKVANGPLCGRPTIKPTNIWFPFSPLFFLFTILLLLVLRLSYHIMSVPLSSSSSSYSSSPDPLFVCPDSEYISHLWHSCIGSYRLRVTLHSNLSEITLYVTS
jgi:hypothetical protein